eukprot:TRINITY_DN7007_c0_g1_i1.p1 TRINITY_DN7007_c0_g1~~TRINITY_DN7007_c0_g1_i1.p1  ORF type:complete len:526 (-),score=30.66 TRINITY_DN7007_c0_g1_i1:187-1764(-)
MANDPNPTSGAVNTAPPSESDSKEQAPSTNLDTLKLGFHYAVSHGPKLILIPLLAFVAVQIQRNVTVDDVVNFAKYLLDNHLLECVVAGFLVLIAAIVYSLTRPNPIYLVDYSCYRPPDALTITVRNALATARSCGFFDEAALAFQSKVFDRSGLGDRTCLPPCLLTTPPTPSLAEARSEAEMVIFNILDDLFKKTGVDPKKISALVVNCSLFCPTPSLSAMIVNKYNMRHDVQSYNLGGMGCSAGLIAVKLAQDLLQRSKGTYAVVVSTENISQNIYLGKRRSMQVSNCLFRVGGAAILLTNKNSERYRAKYELKHAIRTHMGKDSKCYNCVFQEEDDEKLVGVALSRDLMRVAGDALRMNITTLGPLVLPLSEQLLFAAVLVARKLFGMKLKPYVPDFKLAFEHFCIHAGGRAVIDEVEKNLELTRWHVEPSRMTLYRFGNTSSSSIWYELSYSEAAGRVRMGDRVWQIAFGSGFKCQSAVWKAIRRIDPKVSRGPWADYYEPGSGHNLAAHVADAEAPSRPL